MRPPSLTAVQCADSPHSPAHAPCSPPATSHYTTGRLQAWDLCAPCRRLLHCGADIPAPTPPVREERSALRMAKKRSEPRRPSTPTAFEQARDELFSHILRCGVLEASAEHQKEWFDDTMLYLADRYEELDEPQLAELRLVQLFVTVGQIQHRVVEPFLLVLCAGFQHAASQDVGEQFVAGLFECGGGGRASGFRTFLGHAQGAPLFSNWRCGRGEIGAAM